MVFRLRAGLFFSVIAFATPLGAAPVEQGVCPEELFQSVLKDARQRYFSPQNDCPELATAMSEEQLESRIRELGRAGTQVNAAIPPIARCFRESKGGSSLPSNLRRSVIGEYYSLNTRIDLAAAEHLRIATEAAEVLGQSPLDPREAGPSSETLPWSQAAFVEMKQRKECQEQRLPVLVQQTVEATQMVRDLHKTAAGKRDPKAAQTIRAVEAQLNRLLPWMARPEIQKNPTSANVQEGIVAHLNELKSEALKKYHEHLKVSACMNGKATHCFSEHHALLEKLDDLNFQDEKNSLLAEARSLPRQDPQRFELSERISALDFVERGGCIERMRSLGRHKEKEVNCLVADVGLTLATFGAGSLIAGIKAASAALTVANTAQKAARASGAAARIWGAATEARGLSFYSRVAQWKPALRAARTAVLGSDLKMFHDGISNATEACTQRQVDILTEAEGLNSESARAERCADLRLNARVVEQHRSCLMASIVAATGLLPLTSPALSKVFKTVPREAEKLEIPAYREAPGVDFAKAVNDEAARLTAYGLNGARGTRKLADTAIKEVEKLSVARAQSMAALMKEAPSVETLRRIGEESKQAQFLSELSDRLRVLKGQKIKAPSTIDEFVAQGRFREYHFKPKFTDEAADLGDELRKYGIPREAAKPLFDQRAKAYETAMQSLMKEGKFDEAMQLAFGNQYYREAWERFTNTGSMAATGNDLYARKAQAIANSRIEHPLWGVAARSWFMTELQLANRAPESRAEFDATLSKWKLLPEAERTPENWFIILEKVRARGFLPGSRR